jgi:hypothetical protein
MNERIRQLAEQATSSDGWLFDKDKFAELIVQKCADIGEQYADGNYEVRNQILSHFGLEEPEE